MMVPAAAVAPPVTQMVTLMVPNGLSWRPASLVQQLTCTWMWMLTWCMACSISCSCSCAKRCSRTSVSAALGWHLKDLFYRSRTCCISSNVWQQSAMAGQDSNSQQQQPAALQVHLSTSFTQGDLLSAPFACCSDIPDEEDDFLDPLSGPLDGDDEDQVGSLTPRGRGGAGCTLCAGCTVVACQQRDQLGGIPVRTVSKPC